MNNESRRGPSRMIGLYLLDACAISDNDALLSHLGFSHDGLRSALMNRGTTNSQSKLGLAQAADPKDVCALTPLPLTFELTHSYSILNPPEYRSSHVGSSNIWEEHCSRVPTVWKTAGSKKKKQERGISKSAPPTHRSDAHRQSLHLFFSHALTLSRCS